MKTAAESAKVEILEVSSQKELASFIDLPFDLYRGDPMYSPQLIRDQKVHFSPKNPFFEQAEISFFIAKKENKVVGRIACIINQTHLQIHSDGAGFFGFFESIDCEATARALLSAVAARLKSRGCALMRGPMNFSTNEECGILINGFDEPPMLMTPYNKPYYETLMSASGMSTCKNLHAYVHDVKEDLPEKIMRVAAIAEKKGITARQVTKDYFMEAMASFREIYNSAWEHNWGFLPLTEAELLHSAEQLKPIVVHDLMAVALHEGRPVGFIGMVPDFNFVLRKMNGRLNPVTIAKALYYSRKIPDLRMMLLGIRPEYRNRGVDAVLFREGFKGVKRGGYRRVEFSWILEENINVIRQVEMIGSRLYKIYRVYEKAL